MTARSALWTQGGSTSAEEDRSLITAEFPVPGIVAQGDLAVVQHGTPNMSVDVSPGRICVAGTENALQGRYLGWLDATANVVIAASDPTNPRIDLVVAKFQDAQYSGATNAFSVVAVTGTPAGSPVAPAAPNNSFILAQIAVGASVASILTANITDKRTGTGGVLPIVGPNGLYPASPVDGLAVYRNSNDNNEGVEAWNGTAWRKPWSSDWGVVGTPGTAVASQTGWTTVVDATGLSVAFTAIANRRYRVVGNLVMGSTVIGDQITLTLADGSNNVKQTWVFNAPGASYAVPLTPIFDVLGLAAGANTLKFRVTRTGGTGTGIISASATQIASITIEDRGPNGAPA